MDTNDIHQTSTLIADNCDPLRTKSGQEVTGPISHSIAFRSRDEAIEHLCMKVFGVAPVFPDTPAPSPPLRGRPGVIDLLRKVTGDPMAEPTPPAPVEEWEPLAVIRRLGDLYRSNKSDTEVSARAMAMIQEFAARLSRATPPAERPTPTIKAPSRERCLQLADMEGDYTVGSISPDLTERPTPVSLDPMMERALRAEQELAEAREQRDRLADALREAEAGLVFAGADKEPEGQFIPSPTLALRIVREALKSIES